MKKANKKITILKKNAFIGGRKLIRERLLKLFNTAKVN